jgi:hypothetical protein
MPEVAAERWGAACGFAGVAAGALGGALERGWPGADAPIAVAQLVAASRGAMLAQSAAFLVGAALNLGFLAGLRARLARAEGGPAPLATLAFAAGAIWVGLGMAAQAFQIGIAMSAEVPPSPLLWTATATFGVANLPCAVMLVAVGAAALRTGAFPVWLAVLSFAAAGAEAALCAGTVVRTGPLAPNGWLTAVLYVALLVWLLPTATLLARRGPLVGDR